jgi:hypothetical protein
VPLRHLERLLGLALTTLGAWLTARAWHDAAFLGDFSLAEAAAGPALAAVGLGVTFFRAERSALRDLARLPTKWILLVLFALVLGAIDVGHLRGW